MGPYINNVKNNISDFATYIENQGIDLRIGIIEYRDITVDGVNSTRVHKLKGSTWHYSTADMIDSLAKLSVGGGGDTSETVIDGLGYLVDDANTMLWSSQSYKFAIVLTDADFKINNTHGIYDMNEMVDLLVKSDINTSVITRTSNKNVYANLINKTGGIFADISSYSFSNELKALADSIIKRTKEKKAIYVLPGYLGSELYLNSNKDALVWMNENALILDSVSNYIFRGLGNIIYKKLTGVNYDGPILGLDSDGSGEKVSAKSPYEGAYGVFDTYKDLINKLNTEFVSTGMYEDVILFEYNWLADLNDEADRLEKDIINKGYDKVVFVTHSTGGLLAATYIAKDKRNKNKVEKAIIIAAPLYGSAYSIQAVETGRIDFVDNEVASVLNEYGYSDVFEKKKEDMPTYTHFVIDMLEKGGKALINDIIGTYIKSIAKNSPTTYQLFPSVEYILRIPIEYNSQILTADDYYKMLNGSSNMNKKLTDGSSRSHKYFRENSLKNNILKILMSVDTTLIGLSFGKETPSKIKYKKKFFGGSVYVDIVESDDGDGVIQGISTFAENIYGERVVDYIDYYEKKKNLDHMSLIYNPEALNDICGLIADINKNSSVNSFGIKSFPKTKIMSYDENESLGMSKFVKLYIESPQNVEVYIEDFDGNIVASVKHIENTINFDDEKYTFTSIEKKGFDEEKFRFYSTASDFEKGLNAIIYMPKNGYKVVFKYSGDEELQFGTEISTLDVDGEITATATYLKYDTDKNGNIITLDMIENEATEDNIGSLSDRGDVDVTKYNVEWEIDKRVDLKKIGESQKINIKGIEAAKVTWHTSDKGVVTVSDKGEVTAKGYGRAAVAATDGNRTLICIVTVSKKAEAIHIDDVIMQPGERIVIEPNFDSEGVIDENVTYEYDESLGIIEINKHGVILALSKGTIEVTAITSGGAKTKFTVVVADRGIISVDSVSINEKDVKLPVGIKTTITAIINPHNANNQKVSWYVEDSSIVTIEPDGLKCNIKALAEGETTVTVVTNDGGFTDYVNVSVSDSYTETKKTTKSTRKKSDNANLKNLSIEGVTISPEFRSDILVYNALIDNSTTSVRVFFETEEAADVKIEGAENLKVGSNIINIKVTAESGTMKVYSILIERQDAENIDDKEVIQPDAEIPRAFSDIDGHWAEQQIIELYKLGIIAGFEDGTVRPDRYLTRTELVVLLVKALGLPVSEEPLEFADAKEIPDWAYRYIVTAYKNGIICGYEDNTFRSNRNCSRQEMVTMLMNAFDFGESNEPLTFYDGDEIHRYAKGYVAKSYELGLVRGYPDNTFRPHNNITLAEAAAIIFRLLRN